MENTVQQSSVETKKLSQIAVGCNIKKRKMIIVKRKRNEGIEVLK